MVMEEGTRVWVAKNFIERFRGLSRRTNLDVVKDLLGRFQRQIQSFSKEQKSLEKKYGSMGR